jgi:hypothetical protein
MLESVIEAQWVGGPYDGQHIALETPSRPLRALLPPVPPGIVPPSDDTLHLGPPTIAVYPESTPDGWVLRWPHGAH